MGQVLAFQLLLFQNFHHEQFQLLLFGLDAIAVVQQGADEGGQQQADDGKGAAPKQRVLIGRKKQGVGDQRNGADHRYDDATPQPEGDGGVHHRGGNDQQAGFVERLAGQHTVVDALHRQPGEVAQVVQCHARQQQQQD